LLDGFDDGPSEPWTRWLAFERDRLRAAWCAAALARPDDADNDAAAALALAARLLEADPLDKAALRARTQPEAAPWPRRSNGKTATPCTISSTLEVYG
jgi:hypothetical protein